MRDDHEHARSTATPGAEHDRDDAAQRAPEADRLLEDDELQGVDGGLDFTSQGLPPETRVL